MSIDTNLSIKSGRMTRDPEIKTTATGKTVCSFSIACSGYKEKVNYFDCQAWEKTGEIINNYFKKGKKILVIGEEDQQRWEDDDGKKRMKQIINVQKFEFMDGKNDSDSGNNPAITNTAGNFDENPFSDDDIPF